MGRLHANSHKQPHAVAKSLFGGRVLWFEHLLNHVPPDLLGKQEVLNNPVHHSGLSVRDCLQALQEVLEACIQVSRHSAYLEFLVVFPMVFSHYGFILPETRVG